VGVEEGREIAGGRDFLRERRHEKKQERKLRWHWQGSLLLRPPSRQMLWRQR
jgi:hypothetical protein